jgi:hypothetical protein
MIRTPDGAEVKTWREVTRQYKSKKFTSRQFIVQPHADTRICRIMSGSEIGHHFVQQFLTLSHKPEPFGDHHEDRLAQLAACYQGIRFVACSWNGDNHIQAELEFRENEDSGAAECWTTWLNRGRIQKMLGHIKADREIANIFTDENQSPPWMKTPERKNLRPRSAHCHCSDQEARLSRLEAEVRQHSERLQRLSQQLQPGINQSKPTPDED